MLCEGSSIRSIERITTGTKVNEEVAKNSAAVALGRLGGLKGGKARAESLSAAKRKEIAKKAARSRWKGKTEKSER